ncbi:MAG: ATP-binding cassette domain-containing protein [Candidatus Cloacimonetes bacterium]|jgi:ABC-type nitrate/sulfonate/bicarbonate transport system ATPase subunit|nr:ATP-binding cassette domain-containing protein [Candidatus Cloacimonadota bacterium]
MAILSANNVTKSFLLRKEVITVLKELNLELLPGEFISIVGASGCGKTTLLELFAGLTLPDKGEIYYMDKKITGKTGFLGYMPQNDLLFPWLKVMDNILLPAKVKGLNIKEEKEKARSLLPIFGLESYENHLPWQLSGGLRQRVALARTCMTGSKVWLLDEPLANLDAITRMSLQDWLMSVVKSLELSVILVTHDIDEALYLSHRIELMKDGVFHKSIYVTGEENEAEKTKLKERIRQLL